jgi:hypothetical protein
VRVDFYMQQRDDEPRAGVSDVVLLIAGGHGFEVLEELNMIEVKQGPLRCASTSLPPSCLRL